MRHLVPETIETERLTMRQLQERDWEDLHAYFSDKVATKYTLNREMNKIDSWYLNCSMIGHWHIRGYGPYAVEARGLKKVIGLVGFWYPMDWPGPEIKWALARPYWGQGFATEAGGAAQKIGREYLADLSLVSVIHCRNEASIKLAKTLGASFLREINFNRVNWKIYSH